MFVETHAFKAAFVKGESSGFVVSTDSPLNPRPLFAEIYGQPDCYHIFETRRAAEFQMALAATSHPPRDDLTVTEVRVENIRDYQTLTGLKTVILVNRDGQATQSLRVGDMPLSARSQTPSPFLHREGLRVVHAVPAQKAFTPPPPTSEPCPIGLPPLASPQPRSNRPNSDPFSHVPVDEGEAPTSVIRPASSPALPRTGFIHRLLRALLAPFR